MLHGSDSVTIKQSTPAFESVRRMMTTLELNPFERDCHYGYPYVVGRIGDRTLRGPLLTVPISIEVSGTDLKITPQEDEARFNSLIFRSDQDTDALRRSLERLIDQAPTLPLTSESLQSFCSAVCGELQTLDVSLDAKLDGQIRSAPAEPRSGRFLSVVDCAAVFVAPKTSYFLVSDLEQIGSEAALDPQTPLGVLFGEASDRPTSDDFTDERSVVFPFESNPSQRRVARIVDDSANRVLVVQGPPGTGKSLTIANLACHLVAQDKKVLITSQRDKALEVVDELLGRLKLSQMPMTLLGHDRESKAELRLRLDSIEKTRPLGEAELRKARQQDKFTETVKSLDLERERLARSLVCEHIIEREDALLVQKTSQLRRILVRAASNRRKRRVKRRNPTTSDVLGEELTRQRRGIRNQALRILSTAAESRVSAAGKQSRNQIREFSRLLARNQKAATNFSVFDRLKEDPQRCKMLLEILPCWIMMPDDVARLFPCTPGLFDVVIVDEASQCDLPSMTPALFRAKQAVVAGDSQQMQPRRFAFTNEQVARQAWQQRGLNRHDPNRWLDPLKSDLLLVADIRADERTRLDEHFRSLPPIIQFSNERWYGSGLRLMRDVRSRRYGDPERSIVHLTQVSGGRVREGTQENEEEALALVLALEEHMQHPGFSGASFGVICLFEEQMRLMADLVADTIPEELRAAHRLIVVNPDGFQGDERDVIYYSLSYDAIGMEKSAISQRQADTEHIQGMLNVAFTRAREEMHLFHSADIVDFGKASGSGTIRDWLEYCERFASDQGTREHDRDRADSEFEAEVLAALRKADLSTISQYPSCGYRIDIVAEARGKRVAIECDGEIWHLDEHGELRAEDLDRQEILERAGWRVLRIPYRAWRENSTAQVDRVLAALGLKRIDRNDDKPPVRRAKAPQLSAFESAIVVAVQEGHHDTDSALRSARAKLGYERLGPTIRRNLQQAIRSLVKRKLLYIEDNELFLSSRVRSANIAVNYTRPVYSTPYDPYRYRRR